MTHITCADIPLWRNSPVIIPRSREAGKFSSAQAAALYQEEEACILVDRDSEGNNSVLRPGTLQIKGGRGVCVCVNCY